MKNLNDYNKFVQTLELKASGGLFFHRINEQIYITDYSHRLLGIWELDPGQAIAFKEAMPKVSDQISSSS